MSASKKTVLFSQCETAIRKYHSLGKLNTKKSGTALFSEASSDETNNNLSKDELVLLANLKKKGFEIKPKKRKDWKSKKFGDEPNKKVRKENGKDEHGNWKKC